MNKSDISNIAFIMQEAKSENIFGFDWWLKKLSSLDDRIEEEAKFYIMLDDMDDRRDEIYNELLTEMLGVDWSMKKELKSVDTKAVMDKATLMARKEFFPEEFDEDEEI